LDLPAEIEQKEFARCTMEMARALYAKRTEFEADLDFHQYLETCGIAELLAHNQRAALINIGRYAHISENILQRFPPALNRSDSQRIRNGRVFGHLILFFGGRAMARSYSGDLRARVIEAVEVEGASRREAADRFDISASSAVKWLQRWSESRSAAPKPRGGSVFPLEAHADAILALVAERPDLTLKETLVELL
jgi:putative transposase